MAITWEKISSFEHLSALEEQWHELNFRANHDCLFTSPLWVLSWYKIFWKKGWNLHCFTAFNHEKLIALLPFYYQYSASPIKQKHLFFLGQGEKETAEVATEYPDILIEPSYKAEILASCKSHLTFELFDSFTARAVQEHANILKLFSQHKKQIGFQYIIDKENWAITKLSKNSQSKHKRLTKKLTDKNATFSWVSTVDYDTHLQVMRNFHQARWKKKHQPGAFSEPEFNAFHKLLLASMYLESTIKISTLTLESEIIAVNYYLVSGNTLHFYQSGWDEERYSNLAPGFALHLWSLQNSPESHYDFMLGAFNDSYKDKFKTQKQPLYLLRKNNKPLKQLLMKCLQKMFLN